MANRLCSSCNKLFKFPYLLKRHLDGAYGCIPILRQPILTNNITNINNAMRINQQVDDNAEDRDNTNTNATNNVNVNNNNNINNNNVLDININRYNNIYKCTNCNNNFKHRQSLFKHKKNVLYL